MKLAMISLKTKYRGKEYDFPSKSIANAAKRLSPKNLQSDRTILRTRDETVSNTCERHDAAQRTGCAT